ncbi:MAG TPA: hypothetical protein VEC38_02365 [Candidatus Binataceae bacterium]|nr:hypothetical protein [Candidatus Binataceae bacterium]
MQTAAAASHPLNPGLAFRSIRHRGATVAVFCGREGVEVATVEIEPGATVREPYLWSARSWHLLLEGQASVEQGAERCDLLRGESLFLDDAPYSLSNPAPQRARLLTVLFHTDERSEQPEGGDRR